MYPNEVTRTYKDTDLPHKAACTSPQAYDKLLPQHHDKVIAKPWPDPIDILPAPTPNISSPRPRTTDSPTVPVEREPDLSPPRSPIKDRSDIQEQTFSDRQTSSVDVNNMEPRTESHLTPHQAPPATETTPRRSGRFTRAPNGTHIMKCTSNFQLSSLFISFLFLFHIQKDLGEDRGYSD